jgi:cell division septation protein DedD
MSSPTPNSRRRVVGGAVLARYALAVGSAAVIAYGVTVFPSFRNGRGSDRANSVLSLDAPKLHQAPNQPRRSPRLLAEDLSGVVNEPLLLGVSVAPALDDGSLLVNGLAQGTRLSSGVPVSQAGWELPLHNFAGVYVYAPKEFIGVMNGVIDLLSPSKSIIDSRAVRLEWIAKADSLQPAKPAISESRATGVVVKPMDPDEVASLMQRGRDLLRNGDISLAQLAFQRLANAGIAEGALALANTYDPRYLAEHHFIGIAGDETKARNWYQRARELGSAEADHLLTQKTQ